jgi:uncharacterized protein (TIGR02118 family)
MSDIRKDLSSELSEPEALDRRRLIKGAGAAVTFGMLASAFGAVMPRGVRAADSAAGVNCLTILYPAGEGKSFNADYYRDKHLTMIMKLYGNSIQRFELRKVVAAPTAKPPAYAAAINIWINDLAAFQANNEKYGKAMIDDVPNFTNAQPTIQYDIVHGLAGAERSTIKVGDTCLTILYPNGEGVRWEVEKYRAGHMPLIMRLYGPEAIKRFELRKGNSGQAPGTPPAFIGTVNIYINSQAAFDAAGAKHTKTLVDDVPNFSSVMPTAFPTRIHGIG